MTSLRETPFRIGQGYDVHRFVKDRKLILGGVEIPCALGLDGHSDADAVLHAGLRGDLLDLCGHIVERDRAVARLELQALSVNHISPPAFSDHPPHGAWRRSFRQSWQWDPGRS